jgi:hypothetical protein
MAARKRRIRHDDDTRAKIQATQLINRLTAHINGDVELTSTQVRGIEILLKKTLPDLQSIDLDIEGEIGHEVTHIERSIVKAANSDG